MLTSETAFTFTENPPHESGDYTGNGSFSGSTLNCTITDGYIYGFGTVQFSGNK